MRSLIAPLTLSLVAALSPPLPASGQGLGDAAKRTRSARDKAEKKTAAAPTYTDADLLETRAGGSRSHRRSTSTSGSRRTGTVSFPAGSGAASPAAPTGGGAGSTLTPVAPAAPPPAPGPRPTPAPPVPAPTPGPEGPWVSGYYAGWFWDWHRTVAEALAAVDMTTMTHFIFGRYAPGAGTLGGSPGDLMPGAGTGHTNVEDGLITRAHGVGTKALFMLGGTGDGPGFTASTAPATRATFIANILDKCVAKNYDGVDVDWEDALDSAASQSQLIAFLGELRAAAAARPRYQAPNGPFIITFPGSAVNLNIDLPVPAWKATVASLVDQYNLMSYNLTWDCCGWDTWLAAPLADAAPTHPMSIESSIQAYVDAGVPRSKLGMGVGLYASGYAPPVTGPRQPMSVEYFWPDSVATWAALYRAGMMSANDFRFDTAAQAGYYSYAAPRTFQGDSVGMLVIEDLQSIAAKGAWAKAGNCGGTIVWTINYGYLDTTLGNPPMQAIKQAFR